MYINSLISSQVVPNNKIKPSFKGASNGADDRLKSSYPRQKQVSYPKGYYLGFKGSLQGGLRIDPNIAALFSLPSGKLEQVQEIQRRLMTKVAKEAEIAQIRNYSALISSDAPSYYLESEYRSLPRHIQQLFQHIWIQKAQKRTLSADLAQIKNYVALLELDAPSYYLESAYRSLPRHIQQLFQHPLIQKVQERGLSADLAQIKNYVALLESNAPSYYLESEYHLLPCHIQQLFQHPWIKKAQEEGFSAEELNQVNMILKLIKLNDPRNNIESIYSESSYRVQQLFQHPFIKKAQEEGFSAEELNQVNIILKLIKLNDPRNNIESIYGESSYRVQQLLQQPLVQKPGERDLSEEEINEIKLYMDITFLNVHHIDDVESAYNALPADIKQLFQKLFCSMPKENRERGLSEEEINKTKDYVSLTNLLS